MRGRSRVQKVVVLMADDKNVHVMSNSNKMVDVLGMMEVGYVNVLRNDMFKPVRSADGLS